MYSKFQKIPTLRASLGASKKWNILITTGPKINELNLNSVFWVLNLKNRAYYRNAT